VAELAPRRSRIDARFYIGHGAADHVKELVQANGATCVVVGCELSPAQTRNLEDVVEVTVLDRTQVILDIFAQRARSKEGAIQVELAQLNYLLPRLVGRGTLLSRLGGGIGTRGPGEQKLEVDRRRIRERIGRLEREIESVRRSRSQQRKSRERLPWPAFALVGYTNAGKSLLMNRLSGAGVLVEEKLFATLDPTTRLVELPMGMRALVSDTVGFIRDLPPKLVAAFAATLEEVVEADFLLHVLDASHPEVERHEAVVREVLDELGAGETPVVLALNKIDLVPEADQRERLAKSHPDSVAVSALTGEGIERLLELMAGKVAEGRCWATFRVPPAEGWALALLHERGSVEAQRFEDGVYVVKALVSRRELGKLSRYLAPEGD